MMSKVNSRVLILSGIDKGRTGTVVGYRKDGRVKVEVEPGVWAYVKPEDLEKLQ